jgi:septum site-determining protein MinC
VTENSIQIKGISQGLLVTIEDITWKNASDSLLSKIDASPDFFKGARIAIDLGKLSVKSIELSKLRDLLSKREIVLWAILSESETTLRTAQLLGLFTELGTKPQREKKNTDTTVFEGESAVWIEKNLRAGYKIETKCHVVVVGDVNPGAEITSGGNVMVLGRMSGSVHAGADGDSSAKVMALVLEPTSLMINKVSAAPIEKKKKKQPEIARIQNNEIIIEGWENMRNHRGVL